MSGTTVVVAVRTALRQWFDVNEGMWLRGAAVGGLVGYVMAIRNDQPQLAVRWAARGAMMSMFAPISVPLLLPYYAFVAPVSQPEQR